MTPPLEDRRTATDLLTGVLLPCEEEISAEQLTEERADRMAQHSDFSPAFAPAPTFAPLALGFSPRSPGEAGDDRGSPSSVVASPLGQLWEQQPEDVLL